MHDASLWHVSTCPMCGSSFARQPYASKYCSIECATEAKPVPRGKKSYSPLVEKIRALKRAAKARGQYDAKYGAIVRALARIKMQSGCVDCGYRSHPTALQFDHVRGDKLNDVSRMNTLKDALEEAKKCEVRCANCHSIKTWNWKQEIKQKRRAMDLTILGGGD